MKQQIEKDFVEAFKSKNIVKKNTLGLLKTRISEWEKKNPHNEIQKPDIETIIISEIKKRIQAIDILKSNPSEQAKSNMVKESYEMDILLQYLPKQMSEDELLTELNNLKQITPNITQPQIMGYFNKNFKGKFNNQILINLLKQQQTIF